MKNGGSFGRFVILVHGDHGLRAKTEFDGFGSNNEMTSSQFMDRFSTLFAIKKPGLTGGYVSNPRSVTTLIQHHILERVIPRQPNNYVYTRTNTGKNGFREHRIDLSMWNNGEEP